MTAANSAKTVKKSMNLVVLAAPEFSGISTLTSGTQGKSYKHTFTAAGSKTITFSVSGGSLPGGVTLNAKGKLSGKPTESGTFAFTVTAANSAGETSKDFTLTIAASTVSSNSAYTYSENVKAPDVKGYVDLRSYSDPKDCITEYIVVAELPEVSADVSGMYDFSVELGENAQAGQKLVWLANSDEHSDDDNIAEFFDESGQEIDCVPENRKVNVSARLNAGKTYTPAVAVRR